MHRMDNESYYGSMYIQAAYLGKPRSDQAHFNRSMARKQSRGILKKSKNGGQNQNRNMRFDEKNNTSDTFNEQDKLGMTLDKKPGYQVTSPDELEFEKKKFYLKENKPVPSEDLEKLFENSKYIKGTIMLKVCFATDLKPPLDEIDDKINFQLSTFTEVTYPDDKIMKTPVIHNSSFPIWNHWMSHKFKLTQDKLKPLIIKIKTKNKSEIGTAVININDLLENEGDFLIQGSYRLKSSDNDFTGSIVYLQGCFINSASSVDKTSI